MRKLKTMACVATSLLCSFAIEAHASVLTWTGDTIASGLTWHRPTVNSNPSDGLALAGGGQTYSLEQFSVNQTGIYNLNVTATDAGLAGWGSGSTRSIIAFLYETAFDPALPLANQIENGSCGGACALPNWSHALTAGVDYWIVVSSYCGNGVGDGVGECRAGVQGGGFSASLTGPGDIASAVPEPQSLALISVALLGLAGSRRRARLTTVVL